MKELEYQYQREFLRLFKYPCPVQEYFNYYIGLLAREDQQVLKNYTDFIEYKNDVLEMGFSSPQSYKMDHCIPEFLTHMKTKFPSLEDTISTLGDLKSIKKKDHRASSHNEDLMSIDIVSANFSVLKKYLHGFEYKSWEDMCESLGFHPLLGRSKSFRQICMGKYAPKQLRKLQKNLIMKVLDMFGEKMGKDFVDDNVVFVSHDEIVIKDYRKEDVEQMIGDLKLGVPFKYKEYTTEKVDDFCTLHHEKLEDTVKTTIFGVPENRYFFYFKKFVLNEELDERDIMFIDQGWTAVWKLEKNIKNNLTK